MTDLRVPYGPWRRWVRRLRARTARRRAVAVGAEPSDRIVYTYGLVLVAAMYGPMLWTVLAQAGGPLGGPDGLVVAGLVALAAAGLLGLLTVRLGGPVWVRPVEAWFALGGAFGPRAVLWRRAVVLVVGVASVGAIGGTALAAGALAVLPGAGGGAASAVGAWGLCAALGAQVVLWLGVAAQTPRRRRLARGAAGLLVVLATAVVVSWHVGLLGRACGAAWALCGPEGGPGLVLLLGTAAVAVWCAGQVVLVLPGLVDVDATAAAQQRTVTTGAAAIAGDASGVRGLLGDETPADRAWTLPRGVLARAPLAVRDLVGLVRRPAALGGSVLVGLVGAVLVGRSADGAPGAALAAVTGAALLYGASATWARGLRDMAGQPVPGGLLPWGPARLVAGHLVVPTSVGLLVGAVAFAVTRTVAVAPASLPALEVIAWTVAAVVLALGARAWVSGATTVPPELYTPMTGPAGDMSMLSVGAWYVRGWLVVIAGAWALQRYGLVVAPVAPVLAWLLVRATVRRVGRA